MKVVLQWSQFATSSAEVTDSQQDEAMRSQIVTASNNDEFDTTTGMMSQNATSSSLQKRRTGLTPYAFTEHG